jgi:hypothetical protein
MLVIAGFPTFLLIFVGVLIFFLGRIFSSERRNETRRIFEFYLSANEILRDDDRHWYGFEVQEAIIRGEKILRSMSSAPPLVSFGIGALYQKLDDHSSAVKYLSQSVKISSSESSLVFPSKDLRDYVQMLRKIERSPAEAPMTASAVRSLERLRKNRGNFLLEASLNSMEQTMPFASHIEQRPDSVVDAAPFYTPTVDPGISHGATNLGQFENQWSDESLAPEDARERPKPESAATPDRKTISEVLHDVYDRDLS